MSAVSHVDEKLFIELFASLDMHIESLLSLHSHRDMSDLFYGLMAAVSAVQCKLVSCAELSNESYAGVRDQIVGALDAIREEGGLEQ